MRRLLVVGVVAVLAVGVFVSASLATDRPQFCPTCHEMRPYYDAWSKGPHATKSCIDCHVEPGLPARFAHKFVALKEVADHFRGDTSFPRPAPPVIPNGRCMNCHRDRPIPDRAGFSHADHAAQARCAQCHVDAGHTVSDQALKSAGVFNPDTKPVRFTADKATVGGGKADVPAHPAVGCSDCHDMKAVPCSACHQHPARGHPDVGSRDCSACHRPARTFVFDHNLLGSPCSQCHKAPGGKHPSVNSECGECHKAAGRSWSFNHPSAGEHSWRSRPCTACHPVSYRSVYCTCHNGRPPRD